MNRRLYRSRTDSVIGGVAGGVAEYLDVDPSIVRIVWAVLAIVTGGIFFVLYIVMWIVVPEGAPGPVGPYQPGPGAMPGWTPPGGMPPGGTQGMPAAAPTEGYVAGEAPASDVGAAAAPAAPTGSTAEGTPGWTAYSATEAGYGAHPRRRGSGGAMIFGVVLVLLGAWFLIDEYVPGIDSDLLWPIALVILGVALLFVAMRRTSQT